MPPLIPPLQSSQLVAAVARILPRVPEALQQLSLGDITFDHSECLERVEGLVNSKAIPISAEIFARNPATGELLFHSEGMTLTLEACKVLCGRRGFYIDRGPRVMVWILPILLLLSNVELSPIDKHRFSSIAQTLGDPIDVIASLMHKIRIRSRLYSIAKQHESSGVGGQSRNRSDAEFTRIIGTVLSGFEEVLGPELKSDHFFHDVIDLLGARDHHRRRFWRTAALELADSRTDERLRAYLAIILYILQLISAFIFEVGGGSATPPGGVIAGALLLAFLILVVLLSNMVGGFNSRRTCLDIMMRFVEATAPADVTFTETDKKLILRHTWGEHFHSLHWSGAKDTYRPWKVLGRPWPVLIMFGLATLPVLVAFAGAFIVLLNAAERGVSSRHMMLASIFSAWLVSVLFSSALYRFIGMDTQTRRRIHWWFCLVKDIAIGMPSIIFISLNAVGYFNDCSSWSREMFMGKSAVVALDVDTQYRRNDKTVFPGAVGLVILFQLVFFSVFILWNWRAVQVLRWSEKIRRIAWVKSKGEFWYNRSNYMLFWRNPSIAANN